MLNTASGKRGVTPKQAVEILAKSGCQVDEKQAKEILEIMYFLAKSIVEQNFKQ